MTENINKLFNHFFDIINLSFSIKDKSKMTADEKSELLQHSKKMVQSVELASSEISQINDDQQDELLLKFGEKLFTQCRVQK